MSVLSSTQSTLQRHRTRRAVYQLQTGRSRLHRVREQTKKVGTSGSPILPNGSHPMVPFDRRGLVLKPVSSFEGDPGLGLGALLARPGAFNPSRCLPFTLTLHVLQRVKIR